MKNYNKFQKLSPEERKFVFELCEQNTYVKAAELIAEPSPVGLSLNTSSSALQRFCARYHPDASKTETLGQYANLLQVRHQAAEGAFAEGILTLVQNRILEQLKNGRPLAEMAADFRILKSVHKGFLEDYAWRKAEGSKVERQYCKYLEQISFTDDCDFMRKDIEVGPGAKGVLDNTYRAEFTNEEVDVMGTRVRLLREEEAREARCAAEQQRKESRESATPQTVSMPAPATVPPLGAEDQAQGTSLAAILESIAKVHPSHLSHSSHSHPTSNQQKPLEIPHIPPNPTFPGIAAAIRPFVIDTTPRREN